MNCSLEPVYRAAQALAGTIEAEQIRFGSWPVQILPAYTPLVEEALQTSVEVDYDGIPTRVMRPEYLCAIAIETRRAKDYLRVSMFIEQGAVGIDSLDRLLTRHHLEKARSHIRNWPAQESDG